MKCPRNAPPSIVRLLVLSAGVLALAASGNVQHALAATVVPFEKLSLNERLSTAPDSTAVQVGPRTTTLGQLRAAHLAREAAFLKAASMGSALHGKLLPLQAGGVRTIDGGHTSVVNPANFQIAPQPFVEPPSQYASAPADMKAFCNGAQASACLYLPPGQQVTAEQAGVADWDGLVTQTQCTQEGGSWGAMWNSYFCAFTYPASVVVHFTPATNFKLTQFASCDLSTFAYKVDDHGAISISLRVATPVIMTTDNNPTCVVSVVPGG
jgi:hypothetical protein